MTDNAGLKGAAQIAAKQVASTKNVRIKPDIVERLRTGEPCQPHNDVCRSIEARSGCICAEAADEIERLRKALAEIAALPLVDGGEVENWNRQQELRLNEQARQIAIRALKERASDQFGMARTARETQEELQRLNELDERRWPLEEDND